MDNFESSFKATNHLLEQGYQNIALVTLDSEQSQMNERLGGYEKAIKFIGKNTLIEKIDYTHRHDTAIIDQIEKLLVTNPTIDAVYFATNYLAVSGLEAINRLSLKIPDALGVVVFDDNDLFRVHQPTITAISQPIAEMSVQLINILLNHLEKDKTYTPQIHISPATLVVRQSSVKPKG